ncbi:MAG: Fic family protein, partial [Bdellovibrionota bacterium]
SASFRHLVVIFLSLSTSAAFADDPTDAKTCVMAIEGGGNRISNKTVSPLVALKPEPYSAGSDEVINPLHYIRHQQKENSAEVLKGTEDTFTMLSQFAELEDAFVGGRNFNLGTTNSQILRLVGYESFLNFKRKNPEASALEIYGVETMRAWKEADDFLTAIPIGRLKLSIDLFKKVASYSGKKLKPLPVKIPGITPDENGGFKLWPNFGRDPLTEPLNESQYQILKENKWLEGFVELPRPFSKPGARRGIILYTLPHKVPAKLKALISWYETNEDKLDPIRLAVEFQRAFVSIHPFVDGNGRASRLLMDRILLEHGLPPAMILDHDMDLMTKIEEYEAAARMGVSDSINLLKNEIYSFNNSPMSLATSKLTPEGMFSDKQHQLFAQRYAEIQTYDFRVGDRIFELANDGFIYDQYGIPHEYYQGKFYPIADRMVELYDFGGEVKSDVYESQEYEMTPSGEYVMKDGNYVTKKVAKTIYRRSLSPLKLDVFKKHVRLIERIKKGDVKADKLLTAPLEAIKKANANGLAHVYPWQQETLVKALAIRTEQPEFQLTPFFVADTSYATAIYSGTEPAGALVLAQYEALDLHLAEYEEAAKKLPKLRTAIRQQRVFIHEVAKKELSQSTDLIGRLSPEDAAKL